MPTTYAHWRFGDRALRELDGNTEKAVKDHRALYDIGAQGPDVFFHYNCLKANDVTRFGSKMHRMPMAEHLISFGENYRREKEDREAMLAYLMGFLSHFTLDAYCHGYIERKEEAEGPSHDKIEAQFDRHLMLRDGRDPYRTKVTFSLKPDAFTARVMARLYGQWDEKVMLKSVKDQVFYRDLLRDSGNVKRALLTAAMKAAGAARYLDMMMGPEELPACVSSNLRLDKLFDLAAARYRTLSESLYAFLEEGAAPDGFFSRDFGPGENWRSIPLLPPEEERNYRPEDPA